MLKIRKILNTKFVVLKKKENYIYTAAFDLLDFIMARNKILKNLLLINLSICLGFTQKSSLYTSRGKNWKVNSYFCVLVGCCTNWVLTFTSVIEDIKNLINTNIRKNFKVIVTYIVKHQPE